PQSSRGCCWPPTPTPTSRPTYPPASRSTRPARTRSRTAAARSWTGSSAPTPTSSGCRSRRRGGCWSASGWWSAGRRRRERPAQGLHEQHLLRARDAGGDGQRMVTAAERDRLLHLRDGDDTVGQVERAQGGDAVSEVLRRR